MRYNPDTDRAAYNERVQAESQEKFKAGALAVAAPVAAAPVAPRPVPTAREWDINWSDMEDAHYAHVRCGGRLNPSYATCCNISHAIDVARAMGNFPEVRRLRAQLIARLY